jgi:PIN domain nuclease of toxin-antitoxin system
MKLLLDTHAFIWLDQTPDLVSDRANTFIQDEANTILLSYTSIWEMQIKVNLGKLTFPTPLRKRIQAHERNGLVLIPVELNHIYALEQLPHHHRDPFDRLLIAQAMAEGLPILSNDPLFSQYPVRVVW